MRLICFADRYDVVFRYAKEARGKVSRGVRVFSIHNRCRRRDANGVLRTFSAERSKPTNEAGGFSALRSSKCMSLIENEVVKASVPE